MIVKDLKEKLNDLPENLEIAILECNPVGQRWANWHGVDLYRVRVDQNGNVCWDLSKSCKEVVVLR